MVKEQESEHIGLTYGTSAGLLLEKFGIQRSCFIMGDPELLFCNRYQDQHQHLGWHADDSPSVDPNRPIVVVTFGAGT